MDRGELAMLEYAKRLPEHRRGEFQLAYQAQCKNRSTALVLSLFLGGFGIDRFYLGQPGLGVLKLLSCGALGFWMVIDWLLILGSADRHNIAVVQKLSTLFPIALPPPPQYPQMQGYAQPVR